MFCKYGGETHLPGDSLCQTCLENNRKKEAFELKLQEDVKLFKVTEWEFSDLCEMVKTDFWGSNSFHSFISIALRPLAIISVNQIFCQKPKKNMKNGKRQKNY